MPIYITVNYYKQTLQTSQTLRPNNLTGNFDVIRDVPKLMARWLAKLSNSGMIIIEGKRINEGGSHGVEVPSKVIFKGKTLDTIGSN